MRERIAILLVLLAVLIFTSGLVAQRGGRCGHMPMYDTKTEATFTGTVDKLQPQGCTGRRNGTHLTLKTPSEIMEVRVGPTGFLEQKGFSVSEGDQIDVIGSRVKMGNRDVVIARQITKDNKTIMLRDSQGVPEWSGGGRQND